MVGEEVIAEDVRVIEEVTVAEEEATGRLKLESWRKSTEPRMSKYFPTYIVLIPSLGRQEADTD